MKRRLVTSALPYVNNVPHLGNLIQVLSADVFARACRLMGYDTLYICGTDEYGTATETKAQEEGVSPAELCAKFHAIHKQVYEWFEIDFDKFGRTSSPEQTSIVQEIFCELDKNGYITEQEIEQLFCESCSRFLADRYVRGICPHCGYQDARGDQCENCGKLLDPTDLKDPRCSTCGNTPRIKATKHLYIDLPAIRPKLEAWMKKASTDGFWANNAIQMTQAWIRDGLKPRAITRDLKWGIPVPKPGYENKVFYVWFDAPIGYISITAALAKEKGFDYKTWWQNPDNVELFQFIGKDNIPFHTVIFPSTLLGSGQNWTMLYHMSSTEYLNYEAGKFSKSKGIGVFGTDAIESGIPADIWRFYIFYNRPEKSDFTFTWTDFLEKVNGELIGNLGNLINRTLTFISKFYKGKLPEGTPDTAFWNEINKLETGIREKLDKAELRDAFRDAFLIADIANKRFQATEPWKARTENPEIAHSLLYDLTYVLRDLAIILYPYMPKAMETLAGFLGLSFTGENKLTWENIGHLSGIDAVVNPGILFQKLDSDFIMALKEKYSGTQAERMEDRNKQQQAVAPAQKFAETVDLRVAKIIAIEKHPKADKLYIETLDDGSGTPRTIVSGLVPYYTEEELLGKHIIIVNNLLPAKLRGVESKGMLLAASTKGDDGKEIVEVLEAPQCSPGTKITLQGTVSPITYPEISIDTFFAVPIAVANHLVMVDNTPIVDENGTPIKTSRVVQGTVG